MNVFKTKPKPKQRYCQPGSLHHLAKLNEDDILFIRHTKLNRNEISRRYGISLSVISKIKNNKIWRHV